MKKRYKSRNEENLLPFHIIKAASEGDVSAINACRVRDITPKERYLKILEFRHFVEFFSFNRIAENHKALCYCR